VPYPVQWIAISEAAFSGLQVDPPIYGLRKLLLLAEEAARRSQDPLNLAWDGFSGAWEVWQALRAGLWAAIYWRIGWPTQVTNTLAKAACSLAAVPAPREQDHRTQRAGDP
jgi:hypothetical protein